MAKKLQGKHRNQNTSSAMTADSNVHGHGSLPYRSAISGADEGVLYATQHFIYILCCNILPHSLYLPTHTHYRSSTYQVSLGLQNALNPTQPADCTDGTFSFDARHLLCQHHGGKQLQQDRLRSKTCFCK